MRKDSLPSPGPLSMGVQLHACTAKAISAIEIASVGGGGKAPYAKRLDDFLVAARTAIAAYIDAVVPTVVSRQVGGVAAQYVGGVQVTNASQVRIRTSKELDRSYVPAASAFALASPAKVISDVRLDGPDIVLTVTVPYTTGDTTATVAYTQPGAATNVRDLSGNLLATFAATAATNAVV